MNKISIIVPVYNTSLYLDKCLESIVNQTYKNIEIIVINDGSTDNSLDIIKTWQKKDNRIILIDKKNEGLAIARNCGLERCTGDYIAFVDSDDYISYDMISYLYSLFKDDISITVCNYYNVIDGVIIDKKQNKKDMIINNQKAIKMMLNLNYSFTTGVWNKMYKKEILKDVRFIDKRHEDLTFMSNILINDLSISIGNKSMYYYVSRSDSICNQEFTNLEYDKIVISNKLRDIVISKYPKMNKRAELFCLCYRLSICDKILKENINNKDFLLGTKDLIRDNILYILFSNYNYKRRGQMLLFLISINIYRKIINYKTFLKFGLFCKKY